MPREKLKAARKSKGMTQQQVADALGISLRYYQNIEAGDRTGDFELWDALEDMFGVHQRELREASPTKQGGTKLVKAIDKAFNRRRCQSAQ